MIYPKDALIKRWPKEGKVGVIDSQTDLKKSHSSSFSQFQGLKSHIQMVWMMAWFSSQNLNVFSWAEIAKAGTLEVEWNFNVQLIFC